MECTISFAIAAVVGQTLKASNMLPFSRHVVGRTDSRKLVNISRQYIKKATSNVVDHFIDIHGYYITIISQFIIFYFEILALDYEATVVNYTILSS